MSAYISSEIPGIGNNYAPDPGPHPPDFDEFDLEFGDEQFDNSSTQYCGVNATHQGVIDKIPRYLTSHNAPSQHLSMAKLHEIPTSPLPTIVHHWVELCSGGMLAGLSAALSNGMTINRVTLVEKNRAIRFIAGRMLARLQSKHPAQLSPEAISAAFHIPQDVTTLTAASFHGMPSVDVIFATPPCQPFSIAGNIPGWDSPE